MSGSLSSFLVDVNDWDGESRDNLRICGSDNTTVVCSSGGVARELMSNESRFLDFFVAASNSNGNLQRKTIVPIWSQRLLNSLVREEPEGKSIPLHNDWRGIRLMLSRKIQITVRFREDCTSSMSHGTSDRCPGCRALMSGGCAKATPKDVEFALKENSGRQRRGKPVFAPQRVEWVMFPRGRALKRVRFAEDKRQQC